MTLWPLLAQVWCFFTCSSMLLYWVWVVTISVDDKRTLNTIREILNLCYYADTSQCPNTMKTKELIIDVRRTAFTHHPIHIDGTEAVLSLIGTLNCPNNQILRRPRLPAALLRASLPTVLQSDMGTIGNQKLLQKVVKTSHHLLTASLEHHFLLLETSTESTTSITNDSNLQTVCLPSCPPEGATGAPNHQHQVQEHLFIPQLSPCWTLPTSAHPMNTHAHVGHRDSFGWFPLL